MPEYVQVGTTQASVKCLSLWNGTSNDAPPTGWDQPGFDDSGWSLSAAVTIPATSTMRLPNGVDVTLGSGFVEPVAPFTTTPSPFAQWVNRWTFVQPPSQYLFYLTLAIPGSPNHIQPATLNGTLGYAYEAYGTALTNAKAFDLIGLNGPSSTNLLAWQSATNFVAPHVMFTEVFFVFYVPDAGGFPVAWGTVTPGVNDQGVLGTGNIETLLVPTYMDTRNFPDPDNPQVITISSNGKTTFAVDTYGDLYSCGDNTGFMLGSTDTTEQHLLRNRATNFLMTGNVVDVKVGGDCIIALTRPGAVFTAGLNAHGSAGDGTTTSIVGFDRRISGGTTAALLIGAGEAHSVYASTNTVAAAGDNQYGQIGDGTTTDRTSFTGATGLLGESPLDMAVGGNSNWLLTDSGGGITSQFVWGRAQFGSLGLEAYDAGTGSNHIVSTPIEITPFLTGDLQIHDQITVMYESLVSSGVSISTSSIIGDGVPYGGAADGDGTIVYGTLIGTEGTPGILVTPILALDNIVGLAESGGLVNEWASGDSKATLAAISREYELELSINESYAGLTLLQGAGAQVHYLWPNGDPSQVYLLPDDTREVVYTVQNIAGPGAGVTVRMELDLYNGQLPTGSFVSNIGQNVTVGQSRTLTLESLNAPGYGLQVYLEYSGTPPRTNTVNATLQIYTVSGTNDVLYTWGYGGYGQMGNGLTTATNLFAISENGLSGVSQVCLARRVAFAVAETGAVRQVGAGRSWATVVG